DVPVVRDAAADRHHLAVRFLTTLRPPAATLLPYTTLFRSSLSRANQSVTYRWSMRLPGQGVISPRSTQRSYGTLSSLARCSMVSPGIKPCTRAYIWPSGFITSTAVAVRSVVADRSDRKSTRL